MAEEKISSVVKFKKLDPNAKSPLRKRQSDADWDLFFNSRVEKVILPHTVEKFPTGIAFEIPPGLYGRIEERSSMGAKNIAVRGGVIDRSYRGEIVIMLANANNHRVTIQAGEKIAQIGFKHIYEDEIVEVQELSESSRGAQGFGSSGRF